jgi:small-conductance mechanosensitive channel
MFSNALNVEFIYIAVIAISGLVLGWLIEFFLLSRILKYLGTGGWEGVPYLKKSIRGFFTFGLFIAGLYASVTYALEEPKYLEYTNFTVKILYILFLTVYSGRTFTGLLRYYTHREDSHLPNSSILMILVRAVVYIVGFIFILNALNISITPILTALGVGGLAVALALQDTLTNLFAGLQILASKKFHIGDTIRLDSGEEGVVEDISWRNTTLRTLRDNIVVVPNAKVSTAILYNFDMPQSEFDIVVEGSVSYDSDLDRVEVVVLDEAVKLMGEPDFKVEEFVPFVRFYAFADSGILFRVFLRTHTFQDQFALRHLYMKRLHKRFKTEGIEIPYPKRDVYIRSGQ